MVLRGRVVAIIGTLEVRMVEVGVESFRKVWDSLFYGIITGENFCEN